MQWAGKHDRVRGRRWSRLAWASTLTLNGRLTVSLATIQQRLASAASAALCDTPLSWSPVGGGDAPRNAANAPAKAAKKKKKPECKHAWFKVRVSRGGKSIQRICKGVFCWETLNVDKKLLRFVFTRKLHRAPLKVGSFIFNNRTDNASLLFIVPSSRRI